MVKREARALVLAGLVVLGSVAIATTSRADDVQRAKGDAGLGVATVLANVFYMPVKLGYAVVGGVTGGLGYAVTGGNKHVAQRIWVSSMGGDYVLSRDMVSGRQKIHFSGSADPDM